ncbi:MAG: hypothetical protein AAFQ15_07025 [Pseudomonadota bacterium]
MKAHREWQLLRTEWLTYGTMPTGTTALSHFKVFGILLYCLSECPFVAFDKSNDPDPWLEVYGDLKSADDMTLRMVFDGQHYYVAWLLCHNAIEEFEKHRVDKRTSYQSRVTIDFELDIVSHLMSGLHTPSGLYMVMKALFFRE